MGGNQTHLVEKRQAVLFKDALARLKGFEKLNCPTCILTRLPQLENDCPLTRDYFSAFSDVPACSHQGGVGHNAIIAHVWLRSSVSTV